MSYWEGPSRWINTILALIVGFIGFDTLFRLLNANPENVVVNITRTVAGLFLAPFTTMFAESDYLLTALIAVLGYAVLAGALIAIIRTVMAGRDEPPPTTTVRREQQQPTDDRTQRL